MIIHKTHLHSFLMLHRTPYIHVHVYTIYICIHTYRHIHTHTYIYLKWAHTIDTILSSPQVQSRAQVSHFGKTIWCSDMAWETRTCWNSFHPLPKDFFISDKWPPAAPWFCFLFLHSPILVLFCLSFCTPVLWICLLLWVPWGTAQRGWFLFMLFFNSSGFSLSHFYLGQCLSQRTNLWPSVALAWGRWFGVWGGVIATPSFHPDCLPRGSAWLSLSVTFLLSWVIFPHLDTLYSFMKLINQSNIWASLFYSRFYAAP